jgi:hypothetical protein
MRGSRCRCEIERSPGGLRREGSLARCSAGMWRARAGGWAGHARTERRGQGEELGLRQGVHAR